MVQPALGEGDEDKSPELTTTHTSLERTLMNGTRYDIALESTAVESIESPKETIYAWLASEGKSTPRASSPALPSSGGPGSHSRIKRVLFQQVDAALESLEPQRFCPSPAGRKPAKSILKQRTYKHVNLIHDGSQISPPHTHSSFASMLESMCQQLAGSDRGAKVDAYQTLCAAIKASDNVPDPVALKEKMGLLLQFIERDWTARNSTGGFDLALTNEALMTLASFLHNSATSKLLPDSFTINFIEHSIKSLEDSQTSKETVKRMLFVLAQQKFSPKAMATERAARLLNAVNHVEDFVKGKSITLQILEVYRALVRLAPRCMILNTEWLPYLLGCLQSDTPDLRTSAVACGMDCAMMLGHERRISKAVMDLLKVEVDGVTNITRLHRTVEKLLAGSIKVYQVPQIMIVVTLFLRSLGGQLDRWRESFLKILSTCMNHSDKQLKIQANIAWNRWVYVCLCDDWPSPRTVSMLTLPIHKQLDRATIRKPGNIMLRRAALGCLYNLLYYLLQPSMTVRRAQLDIYKQYDILWDECVRKVMDQAWVRQNVNLTTDEARTDLQDACHLLTSLMELKIPQQWDDKRALSDRMVDIEELPTIDARWVRKNSPRLFAVLTPLIESTFEDLSISSKPATRLWMTYLKLLESIAAKEVQIAHEAMDCLAHILSLLHGIWQKGPRNFEQRLSVDRGTSFLASFENIISSTIEHLRLPAFTEKKLVTLRPGEFSPMQTPSQRNVAVQENIRSPLAHFIVLCASPSPGLVVDSQFSQMIKRVLDPFVRSRDASKAKRALLQDLLNALPNNDSEGSLAIWKVLTGFATEVNNASTHDSSSSSIEEPLGARYRADLGFLETGIILSRSMVPAEWESYFLSMVDVATAEIGKPGCAIAVIEPLAEFLIVQSASSKLFFNTANLAYLTILLNHAPYAIDQAALDAARKKLWMHSTAVATTKKTFDPYNHLYNFARQCLAKSYTSFSQIRSTEYTEMFVALDSLLNRCPPELLLAAFANMQDGLACWIADADHRLLGSRDTLMQAVSLFYPHLNHYLISSRSANYGAWYVSDSEARRTR